MREHSSPISIMLHFQSDILQSPEETSTWQRVSPRVQSLQIPLQQYKTPINGILKERLFTRGDDEETIFKDI